MEDPAPADPTEDGPETGDLEQIALEAIQVPAIYTTSVTVMTTAHAIRIAFGEAAAGTRKVHVSVAMDFEIARRLRKRLEAAIERHDLEATDVAPIEDGKI
jgi:hypothetical protein